MITGNVFLIIGLVGITNILTRSFILQPLREIVPTNTLKYMVACPMCMGFWVGVLYFFAFRPTTTSFTLFSSFVETFIYGGLISACSAFGVLLLDYIAFLKTALLDEISRGNPPVDTDKMDE